MYLKQVRTVERELGGQDVLDACRPPVNGLLEIERMLFDYFPHHRGPCPHPGSLARSLFIPRVDSKSEYMDLLGTVDSLSLAIDIMNDRNEKC